MPDRTTALLVMDLQEGIVGRLDDSAVVDAASRAVDTARAHGLPVFFVRVAFRPGFPEVSDANKGFSAIRDTGGEHMHLDAAATQIHSTLEPRDDEPVVVKKRISAFAGSDLDMLLRAKRITDLVLSGVSTSGVVLSTVRQAADLDYRLTVLSDACADTDPEVHRVLLDKLFPRQAVVTDVESWAESLG